jgi:hypothetical protein
MERCKTCKHWVPYETDRQSGSARDNERAGGFCHSDKLTEDFGTHDLDMLVYPYNEGCDAFWTGPEFGCVHHEAA